jgi:excinuclease ABC subunit C
MMYLSLALPKGSDRDAGKEEFYRANGSKFALRFNDPVLYFVQRLRDEAHRFAIGTHRAKRSKAQFTNPLDEVMGVGSGRKTGVIVTFWFGEGSFSRRSRRFEGGKWDFRYFGTDNL